jgi:excisionase family DNA binding protein
VRRLSGEAAEAPATPKAGANDENHSGKRIMPALMEQAPFVASDEEAIIAREAVSRLKPIADAEQNVRLRVMESPDVVVPIPARALRLIANVLDYMAHQTAVSFIPHDRELTTKQAADLLNVSRPHFVEILKRGDIPFRMVGAHRRVKASEVLAYRETGDRKHHEALEEMAKLSQELALD